MSAKPQAPALGLGMSTLRAQIGRFAAVGVASTCLHLGLFAALHLSSSSQSANLIALVIACLLYTSRCV